MYETGNDCDKLEYETGNDCDKLVYETGNDCDKLVYGTGNDCDKLVYETGNDCDKLEYETGNDCDKLEYETGNDCDKLVYGTGNDCDKLDPQCFPGFSLSAAATAGERHNKEVTPECYSQLWTCSIPSSVVLFCPIECFLCRDFSYMETTYICSICRWK